MFAQADHSRSNVRIVMKRINEANKEYLLRRQRRMERHRIRRKDKKRSFVSISQKSSSIASQPKVRSKFLQLYYQKRAYDGQPLKIAVPGELGIETDFPGFLDFAEKIIESNARNLFIDMENCEFIWPSAITLLCSLVQWFELTKSASSIFPKIGSSKSKSDAVNGYLAHCGFYNYVNRPHDATNSHFDASEVVKIVRETSPRNMKVRIQGIKALLKKYSTLSLDQIEDFGDNVLPEVFQNVNEHGVTSRDQGWYTLAQYRPTTGLITICVADNGIGVKNSLLTGPQRDTLLSRFPFNEYDDAEVILEAMKENISGAWDASRATKKGMIRRPRFERGRRRGHGLSRIRDCCERLTIPMTILSGRGAVNIDSNGKIQQQSRQKRIFAGTLYHFVIQANKREKYESS